MCAIPKAPKIPSLPERQVMRQPDSGAPVGNQDYRKMRRAIMAGMMTSPTGALGNPVTAKPTLG